MKKLICYAVSAISIAVFAGKASLDYVDPLVGTEGVGTQYGGVQPNTCVPFGSFHLVPMTRTNRIGRLSFNALDENLEGFILTRQPTIWMGDWGEVRVRIKPVKISGIKASPYRTDVKTEDGRTYSLAATAHAGWIKGLSPDVIAAFPESGVNTNRMDAKYGYPLPNFGGWWHADKSTPGELKIGLSLISKEQAKANLEKEIGKLSFNDVVAAAKAEWEKMFSRLEIDAPEDVKKIFYTGLYRTLLFPRKIDEHGRYYSAFDDRIHNGEMYTCFSLWDTYRAQHPLLTLVAPEYVDGMMQALVNMQREGGWLPKWPNPSYTGIMTGAPAEIVLAEAYVKGFRGFDLKAAYSAVKRNATRPQHIDTVCEWRDRGMFGRTPETRGGLDSYMKLGYVSCDITRESVSRTQDFGYADRAAAILADAVGRHGEAEMFRARSSNYRNNWCAEEGRFLPRRANGLFKPRSSLNRPYRDYCEQSPETATWTVPYDTDGLARLLGGKREAVRRLDEYFDTLFWKPERGNKSIHGNQPSHHTAYLYNRFGVPEKTQFRVREILTRSYSTDRKGFDGNEDCGQMSAWYILSALGFYPLDTICGEYEIGSPIVRGAKLRIGAPYAPAVFEVRVKNYAPDRWRVRRVTLNGRELSDFRIRHADMVKGGVMEFEMDDGCRAEDTVAEAAKELPVIADVDVAVVGGTMSGVAIAGRVKEMGLSAFVVSSRPYLGEDLAGKLRLDVGPLDYKGNICELLRHLTLAEGNPAVPFGGISPFAVKTVFDNYLLTRDIPFLTWTYACDVLRDAEGRVAGIVVVNRNGRQAIRAKTVVDATDRRALARRAGTVFTPFKAENHLFERTVIAGEAPSGEGVEVVSVSEPRVVKTNIRGPQPDGLPVVVTGRLYRCRMELSAKDGSARSFAALEQRARDLTFVPTILDSSDTLFDMESEEVVADVPYVFVPPVQPTLHLTATNAVLFAERVASAAVNRVSAKLADVRPGSGKGALDVREADKGLEGPLRRATGTVTVPAAELPVLAECDVFVAGAGTGGGPAAIASARAGARTIVAEYLYMMGGVMTEGLIGNYCYGCRKGFTAEIDAHVRKTASVYGQAKSEWFRREARKAGAEIWYGSLVEGVVLDGKSLVGVVVVMSDGTRGVVRCRRAIDATGNADLAAVAGEETEFINGQELSLQGVGSSPKILGASYQNTDVAFVDDTDAADLVFFTLRARQSMGDYAWDQSQIVNSRERRRMRGVHFVTSQDVMAGRTYPDTVALTFSTFDTHGQTVDDEFLVENTHRLFYSSFLPYRAMLPVKTDNLLVIGLGMSAARDAMPVLRMQPDVQNQGYVAGLAAAQSVAESVPPRAIDVKALQRKLVKKGIVPARVLAMESNFPQGDEELERHVKGLADGYKRLAKVLWEPKRALAPLRRAHAASPKGSAERLIYAHVLGILGSPEGAEDLVAALRVEQWDEGWEFKGMDQFGRSVSWLDSYMIALGRTKAKGAWSAVAPLAERLSAKDAYSHFRSVALAAESLEEQNAVPVLARLLAMPGVGGHAMKYDSGPVETIPGYKYFTQRNLGIADKERGDCLRELCLARALFRLGDTADGLGRRTLEAYAADPRRAYANHAKMVLSGENR